MNKIVRYTLQVVTECEQTNCVQELKKQGNTDSHPSENVVKKVDPQVKNTQSRIFFLLILIKKTLSGTQTGIYIPCILFCD